MTVVDRAPTGEDVTGPSGKPVLGRESDGRGSTSGSETSHRADIDGLRAVAILGVLAYHFGLGVPGGYGGVDVFFVISGFLIAGIIKRELEAGTFSLANFYVRRIRRILPALTVCLAVTTAAATFILFPRDLTGYARSLLAAAFSVSNFYFLGRNGYFDTGATDKPLLHTWSLAVEEQFYILFPLTLMLLFKYARKAILPVLAAVAILSLAYSARAVADAPEKAFFSTFGRAWELGIGVLVALGAVPQISQRWASEALAAFGVLLITACFFVYSDETAFPGLAALPLCIGAALIIHAGTRTPTSVVARLLASPPMVWFGLISYSVYLWHWPLLVLSSYRFVDVFGADAPHESVARMALAAASIGIGALSWRFVEEPFRRGKRPSSTLVFGAGAAAVLAMTIAALVVLERPQWVRDWPASIDAMQFRRTVPGRALGLKRMPGWTSETYLVGPPGSEPDTVLWGDSFAQAVIPGFITYFDKTGRGAVIAADPGCPPLLGVTFHQRQGAADCKPHNDAIFKKIAGEGIRRVVLLARWSSFARGVVRDSAGNPVTYGKNGQANGEDFAIVMEAMVRRLTALNKEVVVVGPIPSQPFDVSPAMARNIMWGTPLPPALTVRQFNEDQRLVLPVMTRLATVPHVRVVYPHLLLCDADACRYRDNGKALYSDDGHLSPDGVATISGLFDQIFQDRTAP